MATIRREKEKLMHQLGVFDYIFVLMIVVCFLIRGPWEYRNKQVKAV